MNWPLLETMTKECMWCKAAREDAARLWNAMASRKYLFLTANRTDLDNQPFGEELRVCRPVVHCTACGDVGRVLTDDGLQLATWLEKAGLINAEKFKEAVGNAAVNASESPNQ